MLESASTVLIVDDVVANVRIMFDLLNSKGYEVLIAEDGESALMIASEHTPSLILLDVMMPGIDGFETCQRLKNNPKTVEIPIIFMTALADANDKIRGLELGAVDYVTKPFNSEEVLARVKTHLTMRHLQQQLTDQNQRLRELNREKDEFLGIAAHDLKNPLSSIQSLAGLLKDNLQMPLEKRLRYLDMIEISSERMFDLMNALLDMNAIEQGHMDVSLSPTALQPLLHNVVESNKIRASSKRIVLDLRIEQFTPVNALAHEQRLAQVLDNLVSNAIKYSPSGSAISVSLQADEAAARCAVCDQGPGLSEDDQNRLFQKFTRLTPRPTGGESSTGLGLYIVYRMVEAMKGRVWCESQLGKGSDFIVELKRA